MIRLARIKQKRIDLFQLHRKCAYLLLWLALPATVMAQSRAPEGTFIQAGPAVLGGIGVNIGGVMAGSMITKEVHFVSDLEPLFRKTTEQARVSILMGISIRLYGIERTIGNVPYRGFDIDLAVRAGPGLSFSSRDDIVARNNRFALLLEPALRISHARPWKGPGKRGRIFFAEIGAVGPSLRFGLWFPL